MLEQIDWGTMGKINYYNMVFLPVWIWKNPCFVVRDLLVPSYNNSNSRWWHNPVHIRMGLLSMTMLLEEVGNPWHRFYLPNPNTTHVSP